MKNSVKRVPLGVAVACAIGALALPAAAQLDDGEFPKDWFYGDDAARAKHAALAGEEAPELHVSEWLNVDDELMNIEDGFTWEDLEGKVVLLDYWATW